MSASLWSSAPPHPGGEQRSRWRLGPRAAAGYDGSGGQHSPKIHMTWNQSLLDFIWKQQLEGLRLDATANGGKGFVSRMDLPGPPGGRRGQRRNGRSSPFKRDHAGSQGGTHLSMTRKKVKRFRGGLASKAHRLCYHLTLGSRVMRKKE
jgi:hypothetical protein